jgi:hypothetical protein
MKDSLNKNVLVAVTVLVLGTAGYIAYDKPTMVVDNTPVLDNIVGYEESKVADLPPLTESDTFVSQITEDDELNLGDNEALPEIAGYALTSVDELPPLTLGESDLPEMAG